MKKNLMMAGCLLVAACAVAAQTADTKAAAAAAKAAEKAAKAAEKARNDKFKALKKECEALVRKDFKGGFANYWHDSIDAARAKYEEALKDGDFTLAQKVDLYARIAQCRLEATRDIEGAMRDFDAAIALAGTNESAKAVAVANKAKILAQIDPEGEAAQQLKAAEQKPAESEAKKTVSVAKQIERLFEAGGIDKVKAELPAFLAAEQQRADADKKSAARPYRDAWVYFTAWWQTRERTGIMKQPGARAFVLELMEQAPEAQRPNAVSLFEFATADAGRRGAPGSNSHGAAVYAKAARYAAQVPELAQNPKNRVKPATVAAADFLLKMYNAKGDAAKVVAAFESTNRVEWAEKLGRAAREFMKEGDEAAARKVWAAREKIAPPPQQPVLDVPYWENGPHDIRGIVESDFYKSAKKGYLNRRYGDNLKFLIETDSAILGREMTTDKGEAFRPTELFAFWDRYGVKILLRSYVDNMAAVKAGFGSPGGYETYLATGIDDPYHCIMFDPKEGGEAGDNFVTQYDNLTGYRQVKRSEGTLVFDNLYFDDGAATLIAIPWKAAWNATPWKREAWYLEPIHWAHGGLSWGGSKSVHHRSSFGKLRFTGGDAKSYAAVKRTLLPVAKAKFNAACSARSAGQVEVWQDPELGDQEFYLAEVKPLVERIKPLMDGVKPDMSDEDAVRTWDAAGEDALNIDYLVSLKRTEWLNAKRVK